MTDLEFPGAGWPGRLAVGLTRSWWADAPLPPLKPLGAAYGWGARMRRRLHAAFGRTERAARPVISLGNLTVGGSGKTPLALTLAGLLLDRGHRPAVISRGYGRRANRPGPLVVSRGAGPLVGPVESGDEPWLMAATLPALRVVVDKNRLQAAKFAVTELDADFLILDDGFQYLPLAADCRILLAPGRRPFGNGAVLPAGPLR
ncbi:MAG: tetraacyldisaccharide 4'-kinase, partial [Candidatus Adiutrix sp.]|nr:tetraacyldisaccharide 4'-kinase [Candidatus Adiutrix sp.]